MANGVPRHPQVTVVMSVYNGARYVRQAIDSILAQTFTDLELIVVNDGSTDDTSCILASYTDERLILLENESNIGLTRSLNKALRIARGEYIARQDADDFSLPERLARQVRFIATHPDVGLVGCASRWIDGQGKFIQEWVPLTDPAQIQETLLSAIPFLHGTFLFRRSCLEDIGGGYNEEMPVAQDCDLLLRVADRWQLANLPELLYIHRRHPDTITARHQVEQKRFERLAQMDACRRRLTYGLARLGLSRQNVPIWVRSADKKWFAQRFLWWSAGARALNKRIALQFLMIALLLDPVSEAAYAYIWGILGRKLRLWDAPSKDG